jgi:DNA polymerase-1
MISLDLETHKIQPGLLTPPIVCGSMSRKAGEGALLKPRQAIGEFKAACTTSEIVVGANIAYDFACVLAASPELLELVFDKYERGEIHDILIAQALDAIAKGYFRDKMIVDPRTGGSIRAPAYSSSGEPEGKMAKRYSQAIVVDLVLGRSNAKENDAYRTSYALLEGKPFAEWPEIARKYPVDDAVNAYEVAEAQRQGHENLKDMGVQTRAALAEHLAAVWGMRTDPARVAALEVELTKKYADQLAQVQSLGILRPDGSKDMKRLAELVDVAYLGNPPRTATGKVSTARDVLEDSADEKLEAFGKLSKTEKLLKTYLPFLKQGTTRPINISPNVLLANGRSSYDGLIQLLPRKGGVRDCFCARPGTVWCSVDYSAIEMATLAEVCLTHVGFSKLADAINAGYDPHTLFTANMYGIPYEQAIALVKKPDPVWVDRRQMNKAADFGYPGCMGAYKFAQSKRKEGLKLCLAARLADECGVEMISTWKGHDYPVPACKKCVEQAEKLRLAYLDAWPEVPELFRWVTGELDMTGGRITQLVSGRVRGGLEVPSGTNTLFSGLAADGAKRALWRVTRECYVDKSSPLYGCRRGGDLRARRDHHRDARGPGATRRRGGKPRS